MEGYGSALMEGILLGIGLAFLVGPAFFALLNASLHYGLGVSVALAAGVVSSDVLLITGSYFLLQPLKSIPHFNLWLAAIGGVVVSIAGITTILNRNQKAERPDFKIKDFGKLFLKGFSINTFNPFPWMFWLSTSAVAQVRFSAYSGGVVFTYFAVAACTVFLTDVAKAWLAQYIQPFLSDKILARIKIVSGLCLIGFGVRLFAFLF